MRSTSILLALPFALFVGCSERESQSENLAMFPIPKDVDLTEEQICFSDTLYFETETAALDPLFDVLREELMTLSGILLAQTPSSRKANITLLIDSTLKGESYRLETGSGIRISGKDLHAVAQGSVTFLQSSEFSSHAVCVRTGTIQDHPDEPYRGVLIDVARRKHDLETIKNVVRLCRWYKINFLQLHLTDDQFFTFPSDAYPEVVTVASSFTKEALKELVAFSHARGVELVPELEVPGHSGQMIRKMPALFGFSDPALNRSTINMAKEEVYSALDILVGEISSTFMHSNYMHIGGDETDFRGMENNGDVKQYMQRNDLSSIEELYWHFINRMNDAVKKHGKKTIVWEGFSKEGNATIDKDITVMAWETKYQLPQDLLAGGFKIINVSWVPLYVVNEKKWPPLEIYRWNIYKWANWVPVMPSYTPFEIPPHPNVLGASLASWEQDGYEEISSLRLRAGAIAERLWNSASDLADSVFLSKSGKAGKMFSRYLSPVKLTREGLTDPATEDGQYNEETWFHDSLKVLLTTRPGLTIRYTLDGTSVNINSPLFNEMLMIHSSTELRYRAWEGGEPVGAEVLQYFELNPVMMKLESRFTIPLDSLWATPRSGVIGYEDSVVITLSASLKGTIRYVMGDGELHARSSPYTTPLVVNDTTVVKAGLFLQDALVGKPAIKYFRREK